MPGECSLVEGRVLHFLEMIWRARPGRNSRAKDRKLVLASGPDTNVPQTCAKTTRQTLMACTTAMAVVCLQAVAGMQMPKTKQEPFFIGVAGGTASGKTSVVDKVVRALRHESVVSITMDCFYRDLTQAERDRAHACDFDFDHPNAVSHGPPVEPRTHRSCGPGWSSPSVHD